MSKINKVDRAKEYPKQCASIVMDKTLTCEAWLTRASAKGGVPPFEIFRTSTDSEIGEFASRFGLILINNDKQVSTGNIEFSEMYDIINRTNFALNKSYELELAPQKSSGPEKSIAYTTKFVAGNLKGKSPAQVILENGEEEGKKILNDQYVFLKKNLQKYKDNQKIMDAIVESGNLLKEGKLSKDEISSGSNEFVIYDGGIKPLIRKKHPKNQNLCKIYEIKIVCDFSRRYPVNIKVLNYFAPVEKKENGTLNVQKAKMDKSTLINNQINVTLLVWEGFVRSIERCMNAFERQFSPLCLAEGSRLIQEQKEKYFNNVSADVPASAPAAPVIENSSGNSSGYESFDEYEDNLPFD